MRSPLVLAELVAGPAGPLDELRAAMWVADQYRRVGLPPVDPGSRLAR